MASSLFPAVRRVYENPIVRWVVRGSASLAILAFTTGIWPFLKGWAATRADVDAVESVDARVDKLEAARTVNFKRLGTDDTGVLTEGEQLQWALIRIKRQDMRLVSETRARIGLEAQLRMPNPRSEAARRYAASVRAKFDDLVFAGEDPGVAAQKALE